MPDLAVVEGGGGQAMSETHAGVAPVALGSICEQLRNAQVERRFCIGQQSRLNNALGSLARWQLGWNLGLPEKERESIRSP